MERLYHLRILFQKGNMLSKGVLNLSRLIITILGAGLFCGVMNLYIGHTFFLNGYCVHTGIVQNLTLFGTGRPK